VSTTIVGAVINSNTSFNGGGAIGSGNGGLSISNSTISDNTATYGGGIRCDDNIVLSGDTIQGNTATDGNGGGVNFDGDNYSITNCDIYGNSASANGGGAIVAGGGGSIISDSEIQDNHAGGSGGGIDLLATNGTLFACSINSNSAGADGGGIYSYISGEVLSGCDVEGDTAQGNGGGIFLKQLYLSAYSCAIEGDSASGDGGGIYIANSGQVYAISHSQIDDDTAAESGGGIFNDGTIGVADHYRKSGIRYSTVSEDVAIGGDGGGISSGVDAGDVYVDYSTVSADTADLNGGGVFDSHGVLTATNSTIALDTANGASSAGGGVDVTSDAGVPTFDDCTVSGDSAVNGGGLELNTAEVGLDDTIVSANTATGDGYDIAGSAEVATEDGYGNLVGVVPESLGLVSGDGNQLDVTNPNLAPLGYHGGPTPTMPPLPSSDADGAGVGDIGHFDLPTLDQRLTTWPTTSPDIGAVEVGTSQSIEVNTTSDDSSLAEGPVSGVLSLRGAIYLADQNSGPTTITFASGVLSAGTINFTPTLGPLTLNGFDTLISVPGAGIVISGSIVTDTWLWLAGGTSSNPITLGSVSGMGELAVGTDSSHPAYVQIASGTTAPTDSQVNLIVGTGSTVDLNGNSYDFGPLSGNGTIFNSMADTTTVLTVGGNANTIFSGTICDPSTDGTVGLALTGFGTLLLTGTNTYEGGTQIDSGELDIGTLSAWPTNTALSIGGTTLAGAVGLDTITLGFTVSNLTVNSGSTLNVNDNAVFIDYGTGADPASAIQDYLASGFSGEWRTGQISSYVVYTANNAQSTLVYSVGYADGADGITGLSSGQIEILPTLAGDAKMEGNVVFWDFQLLSQYFGSAGGWDQGNFSYGSEVDFGDFQLLSQNFGSNNSALAGYIPDPAPALVTLTLVASGGNYTVYANDTSTNNAGIVSFDVDVVGDGGAEVTSSYNYAPSGVAEFRVGRGGYILAAGFAEWKSNGDDGGDGTGQLRVVA
jgi:autotransporter-associated beta strand protein/predicted outer membrane repeat protein